VKVLFNNAATGARTEAKVQPGKTAIRSFAAQGRRPGPGLERGVGLASFGLADGAPPLRRDTVELADTSFVAFLIERLRAAKRREWSHRSL